MTNKPLTPKQARFVEEYLVDLNATQAAIRAGYSENTASEIGYENLRKPQIAEAIQKARLERSEKTESSAEWVIKRLEIEAEKKESSGAERISALDKLGKHHGVYEVDNSQKVQIPPSLMVFAAPDLPLPSSDED